jgi:hypothetical protein
MFISEAFCRCTEAEFWMILGGAALLFEALFVAPFVIIGLLWQRQERQEQLKVDR